MSDTLFLCFAH